MLRDHAFGELFVDGARPERWDHVFATIQSAAAGLAERTPPDHFAFVIVDECHHAPADSYQKVIASLRPDILLGLTATPERADGRSLLPDFDGRIAAELRLWHALEKQLLVPFEYYGLADGTDLSRVRWSRTGYHTGDLAGLYTGNEARVDLIVEQLRLRVADLGSMKALAFCVSVAHAEFMAAALAARGIPALAVHGGTDDAVRADAPRRLREGSVKVLCTCDLYNEGVDLPFVDVLLLLRPTASATLFLQQIGRGLRLAPGKASCVVLDFIGQHRTEFRFDALYAALTGVPGPKLAAAVGDEFPFLPSGCVLQLDAVARARVLASLKSAVARAPVLARELRELAAAGRAVTLADYLNETGRTLEDVYADGVGGWSALRAAAGLRDALDDETRGVTRLLERVLHVDDPARLAAWSAAVNGEGTWSVANDAPSPRAEPSDYEKRVVAMLEHQLSHRGVLREATATAQWLGSRPAVREEWRELAAVLSDRIAVARDVRPVSEWPLALHRHYERREIVAAVGHVKAGEKAGIPQGGILMLKDEKRELLFVTLNKSDKSFSPTTRYRDYAISPTLFHWESQAAASVAKPTGQRYVGSASNGWRFYLFVRSDTSSPFAFLGPVTYVSHEGDRPIGIVWKLETPMPGALFDRFATLAQG